MRLNQGSLMGGKLLAVTDDLIPLQSELTTHKNDTVSHVTQADRNDWSGKETTAGAQAKVNAHSLLTTNPHNVTKSQVGLGNVDNIQQATKSEFNTHAADTALHVTSAKQAAWDAKETPAGAQAKADAAVASAKGYTDTEVAKLVDSSPETMNTLNELAKALGDDPNFATTMSNEIGTKLPTTTFDAHAGDATHITAVERTSWNSKAAGTHTHAIADTTGLQVALDDRYTKAAANTLYDAKANKTVTLSGGTGITASIGDLSANRTISIDSTVARKDTRSDGYHWFRRSSTPGVPVLYLTQQSSGDIVQFLQGAGDGTLRSAIANDGQFTGNAYTASKWQTARTLSLTGDASGSVAFDGSANMSLDIQVTDDSHGHTILKSKDNRTPKPSDFSNANDGLETIFTTANVNGSTPFADGIVLSTWNNSSGGGVNMLTFRKDKAEIGHRYGAWNGTSWEGYRRLAYADELAWGNLSGVPSEFTPSAHDHDDRYYLKAQVDGFLGGKSDTGHTHTLDSLSDALMTSKAANQFVKWNGTKWVNAALSATDVPSLDTAKITSGTFSTARLPSATTSASGIAQLNDATNSTSTTQAATANAVKKTYDLADAALPKAGGTITGALTVGGNLNINGTQIGMSNDPNVIVGIDNNSEARTNYYAGADSLTFQFDNSPTNTVLKSGHVDVQTVYADKKVGVGSFRMEYNATEQSLDFVFG